MDGWSEFWWGPLSNCSWVTFASPLCITVQGLLWPNFLLFMCTGMSLNQTVMENVGPRWSEMAPLLLNYGRDGNEEATEVIRERFFGNQSQIDAANMELNFSNLFTEYWFFNEFDRAVKLHMRESPMYLYYFTYKSPLSLYPGFRVVSENDYIAPEVKMALLLLRDLFSKYILQSPNVVPGNFLIRFDSFSQFYCQMEALDWRNFCIFKARAMQMSFRSCSDSILCSTYTDTQSCMISPRKWSNLGLPLPVGGKRFSQPCDIFRKSKVFPVHHTLFSFAGHL